MQSGTLVGFSPFGETADRSGKSHLEGSAVPWEGKSSGSGVALRWPDLSLQGDLAIVGSRDPTTTETLLGRVLQVNLLTKGVQTFAPGRVGTVLLSDDDE